MHAKHKSDVKNIDWGDFTGSLRILTMLLA